MRVVLLRLLARRFACLAVMSVAAVVCLQVPVCCEPDNRPIVVLRDDDCRSTWRTPFPEFGNISAFDYGKLKRIPITWGIITSEADKPAGALTWSELRDYLDTAGGEAASHSVLHQNMPNTQAFIDEIVQSKAAINARLGPQYTCNTFLQPGAWTGDAYLDRFDKLDNPIGQAIQANYAQSRAYLGSGWQVGRVYYRYGLTTDSLDYPTCKTELDVSSKLDVIANTPGLVYGINCHGIQSSTGTASYAVRANVMKFFMDRLAELRDEGTVRLMGLNEALAAQTSTDLNRIPNPGFEVTTPGYGNPAVPWLWFSGARVLDGQGTNGSRCARMAGPGSNFRTGVCIEPPGRYELSWYQKVQDGYPAGSAAYVVAVNYGPPYSETMRKTCDGVKVSNVDASQWEHKTVLLCTKDRLPQVQATFQTFNPASGVLVDDVSLIARPVDPQVSPSEVVISPSPTGCTVSWLTPNDPTVTEVEVAYGSRTHPLQPKQGTLVGRLAAEPGTRQQISFATQWWNVYGLYFSVFAYRDTRFSEPEIDYAIVDTSGPEVSNLQVRLEPGSQAEASWAVNEPQSSVYTNRWAVGTSSGASDVIPWTDTVSSQVTFSYPQTSTQLYFSVKSRNVYGYWSNTVSRKFYESLPVRNVAALPDGCRVTVSGIVSAVFAGEFYMQDADSIRGIRVISTATPAEGQAVSISGVLTTTNGERALIEDP